MITYAQAVINLVGDKFIGGPTDGPVDEIKFTAGTTPPSEKAIQAKLTELRNAEPMRLLREERNRKLAGTDWWCSTDLTPSKAQIDYRKKLRDLPANANPTLDENGNLHDVVWPTKPK